MNLQIKSNPETLAVLQQHRSIRRFLDKTIPEADIQRIVSSTLAVSSSSHGQAFSIINVTNPENRKKLAEYAGNQQQVIDCSHFFVFCADLHRLEGLASRAGADLTASLDSTEMFIIATVDAALAAQNTAVAAEALGLGIVYIGGLRNNPQQVSELLKLPERVYPVFGMCIGYPDPEHIPGLKPRLPREAVFFQDEYAPFEQSVPYLLEYDQTMKQYYLDRTDGRRAETWSDTMIDSKKVPRRMFMKSFLAERGFPLT
ncbi:oxygen-insensitive NADPH nitroreductase [Ferviditalea candida]|uniref:Oxygen-insensitive NADPH nitroreductase n=1 Tax=Ferviditalea candida TaxID=3108399 RepID=A0ABU5ZET5_9BACL|nr:oxygen-insensitive NADPH nitroreductase [Paenibacillaceae bacterium T2]